MMLMNETLFTHHLPLPHAEGEGWVWYMTGWLISFLGFDKFRISTNFLKALHKVTNDIGIPGT